MKYKVGDKVKVRSDLKTSVLYGSLYAAAEMIKKKIVTITYVYDGCYKVVEDDYAWTDEMLEGLVEDELTAEEAIILAQYAGQNAQTAADDKEQQRRTERMEADTEKIRRSSGNSENVDEGVEIINDAPEETSQDIGYSDSEVSADIQ